MFSFNLHQKRIISTLVVFGASILVSSLLCVFYTNVEDRIRIKFSREESVTMDRSIADVISDHDRGFFFSSMIETFKNVTLEEFRSAVVLPTQVFPGVVNTVSRNNPDLYFSAQRVEHNDREAFERKASIDYNRTIQITDSTGEVSGERDVYWPTYYHLLDAISIGRDLLNYPERADALNELIETGNVSATTPFEVGSPMIEGSRTGYIRYFRILTNREGETNVIGLGTRMELQLSRSTNIDSFLSAGNNGRRVVITQAKQGNSEIVYDGGDSALNDLIYEGDTIELGRTSFNVFFYGDKTYDNTEEILIFMSIGLCVSLIIAAWEFLRYTASIDAIQLSEAKSKFLSSVSHEIRTPINGIVGISDVLAKQKHSKETKQYVDIIGSCSSSLLSLLNNVLDMSKIDAGKMDNHETEFVTRTAVLRTVRDAWVVLTAKKSNIGHIYVIISETVPKKITSNDTFLFQILNNLISNAVKFTDDGYIEVKLNAIQSKENTVTISMSVRDTGCGMSQTSVDILFKEFKQVHGNNNKGGTGLGLVISMELAKLMGGTIICTSEIGIGTTFIASFSVNGKIRNDNSQPETVTFGPEHTISDEFIGIHKAINTIDVYIKPETKFLIVDDNKVNRMVLSQMLGSIGAKDITLANDGKQCLHATINVKFDIILMDKYMPELDGVECTLRIRNDSTNGSHLSPIIFISADAESESISQCIAAGGNEFISKPYRLDVLIDKIHKIDNNIVCGRNTVI